MYIVFWQLQPMNIYIYIHILDTALNAKVQTTLL